MNSIFPLIGVLTLAFRIWITEGKLKKVLDFRRRYFSRVLALFYAITWIYNNKNMAFNLICFWSISFLLFAIFGWDIKFFKQWKANQVEEWKNYRTTLLIERITLHIPQLIFTLYMCFQDFWGFLYGFNIYRDIMDVIVNLMYMTILLYASYMIFDVRYSEKHGWPIGKKLLYIANLPLGITYFLVIAYSILL